MRSEADSVALFRATIAGQLRLIQQASLLFLVILSRKGVYGAKDHYEKNFFKKKTHSHLCSWTGTSLEKNYRYIPKSQICIIFLILFSFLKHYSYSFNSILYYSYFHKPATAYGDWKCKLLSYVPGVIHKQSENRGYRKRGFYRTISLVSS